MKKVRQSSLGNNHAHYRQCKWMGYQAYHTGVTCLNFWKWFSFLAHPAVAYNLSSNFHVGLYTCTLCPFLVIYSSAVMYCSDLYDLFLVGSDGLSQQLHLGSHRLVWVEAEDVRINDDVGCMLFHQLLIQLRIICLPWWWWWWFDVSMSHYQYDPWSPQLVASETCIRISLVTLVMQK